MRSLTITELSGVDVPAQNGARALVMKRADPTPRSVLDLDIELERIAREKRAAGETMQTAFVRLIDVRDPDFLALLGERDVIARNGVKFV